MVHYSTVLPTWLWNADENSSVADIYRCPSQPSKTDVVVSAGLALGIGTHAGMVEASHLDEAPQVVGYEGCLSMFELFGSLRML